MACDAGSSTACSMRQLWVLQLNTKWRSSQSVYDFTIYPAGPVSVSEHTRNHSMSGHYTSSFGSHSFGPFVSSQMTSTGVSLAIKQSTSGQIQLPSVLLSLPLSLSLFCLMYKLNDCITSLSLMHSHCKYFEVRRVQSTAYEEEEKTELKWGIELKWMCPSPVTVSFHTKWDRRKSRGERGRENASSSQVFLWLNWCT